MGPDGDLFGDLVFYGTGPVSSSGQISVPKGARELVGAKPGTPMLVFASERTKQIVLAVPPSELHQLVTEHHAKKATRSHRSRL